MPKDNTAKQKLRERRLVRDFLGCIGIQCRPTGIRSIQQGKTANGQAVTGPDVLVTCLLEDGDVRVGVEVTEYQVDARAGKGSLGRRMSDVCRAVEQSRSRRMRTGVLKQYHGVVLFDQGNPPRQGDAKNIAEQLTHLVKSEALRLRRGESRCFVTGSRRNGEEIPDQYGLLRSHLKKVIVERLDRVCGPLSWYYGSAASVGIVKEVVLRLINKKTKALLKYDRSRASELWLLICAGVEIPHDSGGPRREGVLRLSDPEVHAAALASGFDRVVFWERSGDWCVDLIPPHLQARYR